MLLFSSPFEWRNQIWPNTTAQCTFYTAHCTFCSVFPTWNTLKNKKVGKTVQNVRCAVQNVHCAVVLGQIWLHGSNSLKKKHLLRVSEKSVKNWKNAGKCALEPVCPYPLLKCCPIKLTNLTNLRVVRIPLSDFIIELWSKNLSSIVLLEIEKRRLHRNSTFIETFIN